MPAGRPRKYKDAAEMRAAVMNNSVHQSDDGIFSEAKASVAVVYL